MKIRQKKRLRICLNQPKAHLCLDFSSIKAIKQLANLDTLTKFEFLSNLTRGVADKIEKGTIMRRNSDGIRTNLVPGKNRRGSEKNHKNFRLTLDSCLTKYFWIRKNFEKILKLKLFDLDNAGKSF